MLGSILHLGGGGGISLLKFLPLLPLLASLGMFTTVSEAERGLRKRCGHIVRRRDEKGIKSIPVVLMPGIHLRIPWAHSIEVIDVRDTPVLLDTTTVRIKKYHYITVEANVIFRVVDVYAKRYASENLTVELVGACKSTLREVMQLHKGNYTEACAEDFQEKIAVTAKRLGFAFIQLNITDVTPNAQMHTARAQLKLAKAVRSKRGRKTAAKKVVVAGVGSVTSINDASHA